ncbi:type II toxin-antitoxin system VapC family toxin [Promicromonospora sp. NPDC057138]|uniref:type II toxin-antitoxin system VapC family toxin n=1 Tax=Promicromonospora sp. NPDC057138 TaxID=3346031 RepID=UPI0036347AD8
MIVVADTSGLIASIDTDAPEHEGARKVIDQASTVLIPPVVLAELDHLVTERFGRGVAGSLMDEIVRQTETGRFIVAPLAVDALRAARVVQARYDDLGLDLADAVITVVARDNYTNAVLTLDRRDFRTVRPLTEDKAFRILPDDL